VPTVIARRVTVDRPVDRVFRYLGDFTTTTEWDPGTVRTTLENGDGGVGTRYRNVSRFLGREAELTYVVEELAPNRRVRLRGENKAVVAHDVMTFMSTPSGGTTVSYRAEFELKGLSRLVAPLLGPAFRKLGDEAEAGLRVALERL
jgi:uncharacterized protein YndB with AHSA1/START domain